MAGRILEFSNQELEQRLTTAEEYVIMYKEELDEVATQREEEVQRLKDQIHLLAEELEQVQCRPSMDVHVKVLEEALQAAINEKMHLKAELEKPKVNRTTSTMPLELPTVDAESGDTEELASFLEEGMEENEGGQTIRVYARVRRPLDSEKSSLICTSTCIDIRIRDPGINKSTKTVLKSFPFERVFDSFSSTPEVYSVCEAAVASVGAGGNVCILAYGQTGSGKTYTMQGLMEQSIETLTKGVGLGERLDLGLQCLEVYNDQVRNLLTSDSESRVNRFKDFTSKSTLPLLDISADAIWQVIATANEGRVTKFTEANERSSRSHLLVSLLVRKGEMLGKLTFVDLAGSERLSASKARGDT